MAEQIPKTVIEQQISEGVTEQVNHPSHYNRGKIEVIEVMEDWDLGVHLTEVLKYIARAEHKGNLVQDLKKARWYLNRRIALLEGTLGEEVLPDAPVQLDKLVARAVEELDARVKHHSDGEKNSAFTPKRQDQERVQRVALESFFSWVREELPKEAPDLLEFRSGEKCVSRLDSLLEELKARIKKHDHDRYRSEPYKTQKNNSKKAIRQRNTEVIRNHLESGCVDCGESRIPALQFDHIRDKKENVSNMLYHSIDTLLEEIKKCEIRCANCHAVKTAEEQGWYSFLDGL